MILKVSCAVAASTWKGGLDGGQGRQIEVDRQRVDQRDRGEQPDEAVIPGLQRLHGRSARGRDARERINGGNGRTLHHRRSRRRAVPAQPPGALRPLNPGDRAPADLRTMPDLSGPRLRDPRARRLPHPACRRASGPLHARPQGRRARVPRCMPTSPHHGAPRARRQPGAVRLPPSRPELRAWRRGATDRAAAEIAGRGQGGYVPSRARAAVASGAGRPE